MSSTKSVKDHCGLFGIFGDEDAPYLTFQGLFSLQHRGQEGAGIVSGYSNGRLTGSRGLGLVTEHFNEARLTKLKGDRAIGHVRYSTVGANHRRNVQPLMVESKLGTLAIGHNGTLVNAIALKNEMEQDGAIFRTTIDTEVIIHLLARSGEERVEEALLKQLPQLDGAYSLLVLCQGKMFGIRDPYGFRPLQIGKLNGAYVLASETCAFDLVGAEYLREVEPGEMVMIDDEGLQSIRFAPQKPSLKRCIFELIYLARPDSKVFDRLVYHYRHRCGELLAEANPVEADLVMSVPDSGNCAALGYSNYSGIPYTQGFIRNHYVGRTFIQPIQSQRVSKIGLKLAPVKDLLRGKRLVVVDDSIVRGNTSKRIVERLKESGAKEVHFRAASPPYRFPCYYGVDTPHAEYLIASEKEIEEIRGYLDADSLGYLSIEQALQAAREELSKGPGYDPHEQGFCVACFDGSYPTLGSGTVEKEMLEKVR